MTLFVTYFRTMTPIRFAER